MRLSKEQLEMVVHLIQQKIEIQSQRNESRKCELDLLPEPVVNPWHNHKGAKCEVS